MKWRFDMLNREIVDLALNKIKTRRLDSEALAYSFFEKAMQNDEFKENFKQIKHAEIQNAKSEAYGEKPQYDIKKLQQKQDGILKKLKIDKKSITPHYTCKKCNDVGYIDGKMCSCLKHEINLILYEKSGLSKDIRCFDKCDFSIFDNPENTKKLYTVLKNWCDKENNYTNVILIGKTGAGKTYVMECMANDLIQKETLVYFTSAFELNQNLLKYHTTFDQTKGQFIAMLLEPDYLFIDDLGTEPMLKNVTVEGLYNVLSERMREGKKTVISTNLTPQQIQDYYGDRIFSRLLSQNNSLVLNVENSDLRLKK